MSAYANGKYRSVIGRSCVIASRDAAHDRYESMPMSRAYGVEHGYIDP